MHQNRLLHTSNCSFLFAKSIANQRVEAWWSYLRKVFLQRWINYFKELIDEGLFYPSDEVDQECLIYIFFIRIKIRIRIIRGTI